MIVDIHPFTCLFIGFLFTSFLFGAMIYEKPEKPRSYTAMRTICVRWDSKIQGYRLMPLYIPLETVIALHEKYGKNAPDEVVFQDYANYGIVGVCPA